MKCFTRSLIIATTVATLTGCSYFKTPPIIQGRDKQYLAAHSIAPMKVPPGLSSSALRNDYPVPSGNYPDSEKAVSIIPPGIKN